MLNDWLNSADIAFRFGPAEYTALLLLMLTLVVALAPGSRLKAAGMAVLGLMLGVVWGVDVNSGVVRTFFGLHIPEERWLPAILVFFGFLLPRIADYAWQPQDRRLFTWPRVAYDGLLLYECLPALLLMKQRWLPARIVVPIAMGWGALLWAYAGLTADDLPAGAIAFAAGVLLLRLDCPWPPALVGLGLSSWLEENLRRAMLLSKGDWSTFVTRPISASLLALALVALVISALVRRRHQRRSGPPTGRALTAA